MKSQSAVKNQMQYQLSTALAAPRQDNRDMRPAQDAIPVQAGNIRARLEEAIKRTEAIRYSLTGYAEPQSDGMPSGGESVQGILLDAQTLLSQLEGVLAYTESRLGL